MLVALALLPLAHACAGTGKVSWSREMQRAAHFREQKDYAEAERRLRLALAAAEAEGGAGPRVEATTNALLDLEEERGAPGSAAAVVGRVLPGIEAARGPDDPYVGELLSRLAGYELGAGHLVEGEAAAERAVRILERGAEPRALAAALHRRARLRQALGDSAGAEADSARALGILEGALPDDDLELARLRADLGGLRLELGRPVEAATLVEAAVAVLQDRLRGRDPELIRGFGYRALVRLELRSAEPVDPDLDRLFDLFAHRSVSDQALHRALLERIGGACESAGRLDDAERAYRQLLEFEQAHGEAESLAAGKLLFRLGVLAGRRGETDEAAELLRRATVVFENHPERRGEDLVEVLEAYGAAVLRQGDAGEAARLRARADRLREGP